ncbi:hypothetical protein KAU11_10255 [Candidatus Babeliales bacterium]|nr:hypothetical protein [Candidatus Babeliales bacterium]
MKIATIDAKQFRLGESPTEHEAERGFSPETYGLNLLKEKGMMYPSGSKTDIGSTTLLGKVIAKAKDTSYLGNDQYFLDDEGNFYTYDGTFTKRQTDSVKTYQLGTSDMIQFQGNTFATSTDDIAMLTSSDLTSIDHDWWSITKAHGTMDIGVRHPLEVVEDHLYIGDGNYIHTYDGTTTGYQTIVLPQGVNVISLRKGSDGRSLLAFCGETANYSHSLGLSGKVYYIDTVTFAFIKEVKLESQVEGTINHEGAVMCTWGKNFGYFDGTGLVWMRDLVSDTTYSHNLESMEDTLLIRDSKYVVAYGDLGKGKVFWKMYIAGDSVDVIAYLGSGKVAIGYLSGSTDYLKYFDINEVGSVGYFFSNPITLPGKVWIRRIEIEHDKTTAVWNEFPVNYKADDAGSANITNVSYLSSQTGISRTRLDVNILASIFAVGIQWYNGSLGMRKISIYYESAE